MTTATRASPRSPGRTPPFILVGLLVIVGFLAFSYWRLSSTNNQLVIELETAEIQKKDLDQKSAETEKNLENAREELRSVQGNLDQARKQLQDKDSEIGNLKTDLGTKQADADKLKNLLGQCDTSLAEQKTSLETVKNEKAELEKNLNELKQKQPTCDTAGCTAPIRDVLTVVSKLVGSDAIGKALTEAKFDAGKLLEGIQVPAPEVQQVKADEQKKQDPNQQPVVTKPQVAEEKPQNPPAETQVKSSPEISISESNKTADVTNHSGPALLDKADPLIVQSERDKNIAEISNFLAQKELEKEKKAETVEEANKGGTKDEKKDENKNTDVPNDYADISQKVKQKQEENYKQQS